MKVDRYPYCKTLILVDIRYIFLLLLLLFSRLRKAFLWIAVWMGILQVGVGVVSSAGMRLLCVFLPSYHQIKTESKAQNMHDLM